MVRLSFIIIFALSLGSTSFAQTIDTTITKSKEQNDIYYCPMHPKETFNEPGEVSGLRDGFGKEETRGCKAIVDYEEYFRLRERLVKLPLNI